MKSFCMESAFLAWHNRASMYISQGENGIGVYTAMYSVLWGDDLHVGMISSSPE